MKQSAAQIKQLANAVLDQRSERDKKRFAVRSGIKGGSEVC